MRKQSSIEWLVTELNQMIDYIPLSKWDKIADIVQQAKQMHKEELIEFGNDCLEYMVTDWKGQQTVGEEYYQETYGGNNE